MSNRKKSNVSGVQVWRKKTKLKLVAGFGGKCNKCGYDTCPEALDFHHRDPSSKEFSLSRIMAKPRAWNKIVAEVKKCVMLCCRCHRELHSELWNLSDIEVVEFDDNAQIVETQTGQCPVCNKPTYTLRKTCSRSCAARLARTIKWPDDDTFLAMLSKHSKQKVATMLGVSRSGVDKHLKKIDPRGQLLVVAGGC